jgi:uncharacterized membrane protein
MTNLNRMLAFSVGAMGLGALLSFTQINADANLSEDGLFELAQVFVIAISIVLWLARGPADRTINIFIATVGLLFLGRETSWAEAYGGSDELEDALKYVHAALLIVTLAGLTVVWLSARMRAARVFRAMFRSSFMAWMVLGCGFLLFGDVFEKHIFETESDLFWEEWSELVGNICFMIPPLFRGLFRPNPVTQALA